jgi:hypothetical protein
LISLRAYGDNHVVTSGEPALKPTPAPLLKGSYTFTYTSKYTYHTQNASTASYATGTYVPGKPAITIDTDMGNVKLKLDFRATKTQCREILLSTHTRLDHKILDKITPPYFFSAEGKLDIGHQPEVEALAIVVSPLH